MKKIIYTLFLLPLFIFSQNVDVADDAEILIESGATMTVDGSITTNTSGSMIIETGTTSSGSLIATEAGGSQGKGITLRRYLDGDSEWALIGVPVTGETADDVDDDLRANLLTNKRALGYFDPTSNDGEFVYYTDGATDELTNGRGYAISPQAAGSLDFTGTMAYEDVTYELEEGTGSYGKWNLVGNPFPSYLNMTDDANNQGDNFLDLNEIFLDDEYFGVYAWDGTQYVTYNHFSETINYIAPGEGFFVYTAEGGGEVSFNESLQASTATVLAVGQGNNFNADIARGAKSENVRREFVYIEIKNRLTEKTDITKVYFTDDDRASKGLDRGYDAGKFSSGLESTIYTRLVEEDKGTNFMLQVLPHGDLNELVIPLGIDTKSSSLDLSIKESSIDDFYNLYLHDKLKNTIVELDRTINLEFNQNEINDGRFYLIFTDGSIPELPTDDNLRIFKVSEGEIKLMGDYDTNYNAQIFDFTGRLIKEVEFKHQTKVDRLGKGVQILKIKSDINQEITTKKFILN
tara:strand:+ start:49 stop:1605 length:1557 start_codon:yes stop_codon:yes gene_type:complete